MDRATATQKLERMVTRIEAGQPPLPVVGLYVFGSYARGALHPNDLDVIVVHEPASAEVCAHYETKVAPRHRGFERIAATVRKLEVDMRRCFRRGSEPVEVFLTTDIRELLGRFVEAKDDCTLVWSTDDRDVRAHLAAITPDPNAGRAPRDHFVDVKRTHDDRETVEQVTEMIRRGALCLARTSIDIDVVPELDAPFAAKLQLWAEHAFAGKRVLDALPWGLRWLQEQGAQDAWSIGRGNMFRANTPAGRVRVRVGPLRLAEMLAHLERAPNRECVVPLLRKRGPNEMFVFERGPHW